MQTTRGGTGQRPRPLGRLLGQVERLVSRRLDAVLATDALTVDQWRVVDLLADGAGHTMSEVAATIAVPGPTLTKLVDRLVDSAVVYRLVDVRDRRRVLAFLSDGGHALHVRLAPLVEACEADVLTALGPDDGAVLLDLLDRVATAR